MEVYIENFRSIKNEKYIFESGVTLLDGESGKGKTTILEAIGWCLYGGKNVYPFLYNSKEKEYTKVRVKINDFCIYRSKPPDTVSFKIKDTILVHDEAQAQIERIFGSKNFWESSSYLRQDNRNILMMNMAPSEKISVLKEIIFGKNSEDLIENHYIKLEKYQKDIERNIDIANTKLSFQKDIFKKQISNFENYMEFGKKKYLKIYQRREEIKKSIKTLDLKIIKNIESNSRKRDFENNKKIYEDTSLELTSYPENLNFKSIQMWQKYHIGKKKLEDFDMDFCSNYKDFEKTKKKLEKLKESHKKYLHNLQLSKKYEIDYDEESIDKEVKSLELLLERITAYQKYKEGIINVRKIEEKINVQGDIFFELEKSKGNFRILLDVEKEIQDLKDDLEISEKYEKYKSFLEFLEKLEKAKDNIMEKYHNLMKEIDLEPVKMTPRLRYKISETIDAYSGDHLKCPECNTFLIKKGNTLNKINYKPFNSEKKKSLYEDLETVMSFNKKYIETLENIKKIKTDLEEPSSSPKEILSKLGDCKKEFKKTSSFEKIYSQEEGKLNVLKDTLKSMEIPEKVTEENGDIKKIRDKIFNLKKIEFFEDFSSDILDLEKDLENIKKTNELDYIKKSVEENYLSFFQDFETPSDFDSYFTLYKSCFEKNKLVKKYLEKYEESEIELEDNEILEKKKNILEDNLALSDKYEKYLEIEKCRDELELASEYFKENVKKRDNCIKIKRIIDEVGNETLENLIGELNDLLNDISGDLFDDIIIELEMFKKLKVKKDLKPQFNLLIHLKGNTYENISFLSGGEKDRISISLTLALSILSGNPFILLDECMSSLDEEMRHRVLKLIKTYASDKIVLNICHDSVRGFYDNVIEF